MDNFLVRTPHHTIAVLPGKGILQRMLRISKNEDGSLEEEAFQNFSFVPMLKGRS